MEQNNEHMPQLLSEDSLEKVAGGYIGPDTPVTPDTKNSSFYSSGNTPKYCVGQRVGLKFKYKAAYSHDGYDSVMAPCSVIGVSSTRDSGSICPEFSYTVELLVNVGNARRGTPYYGVYESCLYEE